MTLKMKSYASSVWTYPQRYAAKCYTKWNASQKPTYKENKKNPVSSSNIHFRTHERERVRFLQESVCLVGRQKWNGDVDHLAGADNIVPLVGDLDQLRHAGWPKRLLPLSFCLCLVLPCLVMSCLARVFR